MWRRGASWGVEFIHALILRKESSWTNQPSSFVLPATRSLTRVRYVTIRRGRLVGRFYITVETFSRWCLVVPTRLLPEDGGVEKLHAPYHPTT